MWVIISIIISGLVLLVMVGQWYLQRMQQIHNEKSVKPLGQIDLPDYKKKLAVHIRNNGLGPLIVDRFIFKKGDTICSTIEGCLGLDPRSYMHISVDDSVQRVILPNSYLAVFEKNFGDHADEADINNVRKQLSLIKLKVEFHDIYDNKMTIERDFQWFARHISENL